jgi:ABC-2 type transport system permease protein
MIGTIFWISARRLWHNKAELLLTFVVPVVFFSIFALILGDRSRVSSAKSVPVALCDEAGTELSQKAIELLAKSDSIRIVTSESTAKAIEKPTRASALRMVQLGEVTMAIVLSNDPVEKSDQIRDANGLRMPKVELITDSYDQIAPQIVSGLVQKTLSTALQDVTPVRTEKIRTVSHQTNPQSLPTVPMPIPLSIPDVHIVDLLGQRQSNPIIAMYAAGIAVMFVLFSATAASGSLLEERENNTLERLLASQMTMDHLLMGKWCFLCVVGCTQLTVMFVFGQLAFGVDLVGHLDGFIAMTLVTAGAASSFALLLASICRTRAQLNWISVVVILSMSALGGSMVPRYLMSEQIRQAGLFTFNAWALDGYNKIFWRDLPLSTIGLELGVLTMIGLIFIIAARILAIRWERDS